MEQPPAIPPTFPPQAAAKKGMPALAWVGIGCGGLLMIVLALGTYVFFMAKKTIDDFTANPEKAAAELVVSMTPELQKISQDEAKGTMTIRTKDGEEMTLSYKDITEGKFVVTDKEGNATQFGSPDLSVVPAWVPKPADLANGMSLSHTDGGTEVSGQFTGNTSMGAKEVIAFYEAQLSFTSASGENTELGGLKVSKKEFRDDKRKVTVVATQKDSQATQVTVNYAETK